MRDEARHEHQRHHQHAPPRETLTVHLQLQRLMGRGRHHIKMQLKLQLLKTFLSTVHFNIHHIILQISQCVCVCVSYLAERVAVMNVLCVGAGLQLIIGHSEGLDGVLKVFLQLNDNA